MLLFFFFIYTRHPCVYSWGKPIRSLQFCFGPTHIMSLKHLHAVAVLVVGATSGLFNCSSLGCTLTFAAAWCGSGWSQGLAHLWVWGVTGKMASSHLLQKPVSLLLLLLLPVGTPGSNDALIALRSASANSSFEFSPIHPLLASAWVLLELYLHPVHPKFHSSPKKPL